MPQSSPPATPPFDAATPQPSHTFAPRQAPSLTPNNTAAGTKRKRATEKKFYAVREGKSPGIYDTWDACLAQGRGHKVRAFPSLHEAQAFINGKTLSQSDGKQPGERKYYAIQNGKKPGIYTDWPLAQAQISGFENPRRKRFSTKAEAEAFVQAGKKNLGFDPSQTLSPEEQIRRLLVRNTAPGLITNRTPEVKDEEGNIYELGTGPLPPGAQDGFDPNIKLGPDGTIVHKTEEKKRKTKMMIRERDPPRMLRIYTDGSSLRNGQAGAQAGVGVYFGPQDPKNVSEALQGSKPTNQRAQLTAIQRALDIAPRHRDVTIYTDSKYAIDCVTNWYKGWQRNGWLNAKGKSVENRDLVKEIRGALGEKEEGGKGTYFFWVKGHAGDEGSMAADRLRLDGARARRSVKSVDERDGEAEGLGSSVDSGGEGNKVEESWNMMGGGSMKRM